MPESHDLERTAANAPSLPSRQELLAADKEELVRRVEALARELRRRVELEEEILHLKFQRGTASLQAQVEDAIRRFRGAEEELEAFRAEILGERGARPRAEARSFAFEDLGAEEGDPSALRTLLSMFRKLRAERDRARDEAAQARQELERLRAARS